MPPPGPRRAPGAVTATRVSSPRAATSAAKECGGSTSSRRIRPRSGLGTDASPARASVPQCTGTTTRGRISATASAALTGSRWPGPRLGPQPQTGSSATSTARLASTAMPSNRPVSPLA